MNSNATSLDDDSYDGIVYNDVSCLCVDAEDMITESTIPNADVAFNDNNVRDDAKDVKMNEDNLLTILEEDEETPWNPHGRFLNQLDQGCSVSLLDQMVESDVDSCRRSTGSYGQASRMPDRFFNHSYLNTPHLIKILCGIWIPV